MYVCIIRKLTQHFPIPTYNAYTSTYVHIRLHMTTPTCTYLRQGLHKIVDVSCLGCLCHLLRRHLPVVRSIADIIRNAPVKQHWFLGDNANLAPKPGNVEVSDIDSVQGQVSRERIVETLQEGDDCALATPTRAHQGEGLPRFDGYVQSLEDRNIGTGWIVEGQGQS